MDRTRHLTKDTYIRAYITNLTRTDAIAATIVVTFEHIGMTDGSPLIPPASMRQDILNHDVAFLLEIESAGVTAIVHIVGKVQQFLSFNLERLTLCSIANREKILIVFPLTIEFIRSAFNRAFIIDLFPTARATFVGIPL